MKRTIAIAALCFCAILPAATVTAPSLPVSGGLTGANLQQFLTAFLGLEPIQQSQLAAVLASATAQSAPEVAQIKINRDLMYQGVIRENPASISKISNLQGKLWGSVYGIYAIDLAAYYPTLTPSQDKQLAALDQALHDTIIAQQPGTLPMHSIGLTLLTGYFNLTAAQQTQTQSILDSARTQATPLGEQLAEQVKALTNAVKAHQSASTIQPLADAAGVTTGQIANVSGQSLEQFYVILTPAQQQQFQALYQQMHGLQK